MSWNEIIVALITAGLLKYLADGVRWLLHRRQDHTPAGRQAAAITTVDQSLAVVARARDELEADNARLREQLAEQDARYVAELARRDAREASLSSEIARLESKVKDILAELDGLKRRHSTDTGPLSRIRYP